MTVTELSGRTTVAQAAPVIALAAEPIVRAAFTRMLDGADGLALVASVGRVDELAAHLDDPTALPVVVAWSCADPEALLAALDAAGLPTRTPVLFVAPDATGPLVERAVTAGVRGFVTADCSPDELMAAIASVAAGDAPYCPGATRWLIGMTARQQTAKGLTDREQQVLDLVADGLLTKQIALRLGITESTVKVHLGRIYQHLGVDNRARAALWARSCGFGSGRSLPTSAAG
jgi:DNA-binding NarL/FixJ family response regulator